MVPNPIVSTIGTPLLWVLFLLVVGGIVVLDAAVLRRAPHVVRVREAALWTIVWVGFALLFCVGTYAFAGVTPALEFLSAYLIEKALSVDNLFVFPALFPTSRYRGSFSIACCAGEFWLRW